MVYTVPLSSLIAAFQSLFVKDDAIHRDSSLGTPKDHQGMTTRNPEVPYFGVIDLDSHLHLKFRNLGAKIWTLLKFLAAVVAIPLNSLNRPAAKEI
jgi:hypothetical protein